MWDRSLVRAIGTAGLLMIVLAAAAPAAPATPLVVCDPGAVGDLASRLRTALDYRAGLGIEPRDLRWVLFPVTRERALPADYEPMDLVWTTAGLAAPQGRQQVRQLILPHLEAMFADASTDGVTLAIYSGYRGYATQRLAFDGGVAQQLARGAESRAEAEERANRFRARPGHSQHQLGTTVDLTTAENGWRLGQGFGETAAGQWLRENAWEYGFIIPYTPLGEATTGYAPEPWHLRWVGRALAARLHADGYLDRATPTPDDYLLAIDLLLSDNPPRCD
jgi:LAS superfamily LD-carboxypeptidase LdcB